jgi:two-component system nitrate/nitrite response regulator NarL
MYKKKRASKMQMACRNGSAGKIPINVRESSTSRVPVILIDSNSLFREGLARLLDATRFHVIASCSSLATLSSALERLPELILIEEPDITVVTRVLEDCKERYPAARRVVLNDCHGEQLMRLFEIGADSCLGRDVSIDALLLSLDLTMLGTNLICRPNLLTAGEYSGERSQNGQAAAGLQLTGESVSDKIPHRLSLREISILDCLMHGDSNKLIARRYQIAEATVKVHIKAILRKIQAANRTQAAIWAMTHLPSIHPKSTLPEHPAAA